MERWQVTTRSRLVNLGVELEQLGNKQKFNKNFLFNIFFRQYPILSLYPYYWEPFERRLRRDL